MLKWPLLYIDLYSLLFIIVKKVKKLGPQGLVENPFFFFFFDALNASPLKDLKGPNCIIVFNDKKLLNSFVMINHLFYLAYTNTFSHLNCHSQPVLKKLVSIRPY